MVGPVEARLTGVVLVHGIGRQRPLDATGKFLKALRRNYGDLEAHEEGTSLEIALPDGTVRLYEAYWADLLAGDAVRETFLGVYTHMIGWFPWLNLRGGLYVSGRQRSSDVRLRARFWTCVCLPLALSAQLLLGLAYAVAFAVQRGPEFQALLDEIPGDVFNYVNSAAGAGPPDWPLRPVADQIDGRLVSALDAAHADGCSQIVVVAHSLGTVIAARVLFGDGYTAPTPVHCLHTIGSPLGTVRFIWPLLVPDPTPGKLSGLTWHNFWDPLDLISTRFSSAPGLPQVHNHCLFGRAGLGSAHVTYEDHPRFMAEFARSLGHKPPTRRLDLLIRARLAIRSSLESLALIGGLGVALLAGFVGCVLIAGTGAVIVSLPNGKGPPAEVTFVLGHFAVLTLAVGAVLFIIVFVGFPVTRGRYTAGLLHYAHRFGQPPPPPMPVEQYRVSVPEWARGEEHWWNRDGPMLAVAVLLVLGGAVALWSFMSVSRAQQVVASLGYPHIGRAVTAVALPVLALVMSGCLLYTILFLVALVVTVWEGAVNGHRRYRSYMRRTTQPPVDR